MIFFTIKTTSNTNSYHPKWQRKVSMTMMNTSTDLKLITKTIMPAVMQTNDFVEVTSSVQITLLKHPTLYGRVFKEFIKIYKYECKVW